MRSAPLDVVVVGVGLEHGFEFFGRRGRSLLQDGLLNKLIAKVVRRGVKYACDRRHVCVEAKVAETLV